MVTNSTENVYKNKGRSGVIHMLNTLRPKLFYGLNGGFKTRPAVGLVQPTGMDDSDVDGVRAGNGTRQSHSSLQRC